MEQTKSTLATTKNGPMRKAERILKQRLFAQLLLDPHTHHTKDSIVQRLGISETTYRKWSQNPELLDWAGHDLRVTDIKVKILASGYKTRAIDTLTDVMENDRNGLARVRAAEIILSMDTQLPEGSTVESKSETLKLLERFKPVLIMGSIEQLRNITKQHMENSLVEEEPSIDAEYKVVDEDEDGYEEDEEDI